MTLADFCALANRIDPGDEASYLALAPALEDLGRSQSYEALKAQAQTSVPIRYAGDATILAYTTLYAVRLLVWEPETWWGWVQSRWAVEYTYARAVAHTHDFALLTYGLSGPGYVTKRWRVPLAHYTVGGHVPWVSLDPVQLREGTSLYYPAFTMAHQQHPPEARSVSLNLLVRVPNPPATLPLGSWPLKQLFCDTRTGRILKDG